MNGEAVNSQPRACPYGRTRLHRAPLATVAILWMAGIAAGRLSPLPVGFWALVGAAGLAVACASFFRRHLHALTAVAVGCALFAVAAVHAHQAYYCLPADHVVTYSGRQPILATLRGRVATSPQTIPNNSPTGYPRGARTTFLLAAEQIATDDGDRGVRGLVSVTVREGDGRLAAGQQVELMGRLGRWRDVDNPGQYDRAAARRTDRIFNWLTVPAADGVTILRGQSPRWYSRILWRVRAAGRQHLADCGDESSGRLMNAMITGERAPGLAALNRAMIRAGVAHYLSISGLHLGVFLGFVYLLCRLAMLTPRKSAVIVLAVLGAYVLLAEPRAPLLRSAIMAASLCMAAVFGRRSVTLNALSAAAIVLLAFDPMELFAAGFQLSFTIVAGLVLLHRPVRQMIFGRWIRRRGLMVFRDKDRLRRWLHHTAVNAMMNAIAACLTAYVMSVPLAAYHFGLFSPYGAVLTLLLFPLVVAVLVPGYVSMALAWPMPNLSYAVGRLSAAAADGLSSVVATLQHAPKLSLELRPVGAGWVALCYVVIGLTVFRRRIPFGSAAAAAALLALVGATAYSQRTAEPPATAELNLLAVGAGQCAVLRTPSGRTYLFDVGSRVDSRVCEQILLPFLRAHRLPDPQTVFVSHANYDHYSGLVALLRRGRLRRVFLNDYFGRDVGDDPDKSPVPELMREMAAGKVSVTRLRAGDRVRLDDRTFVEALWPPAETGEDFSPNDRSLVLRITCDGRRVLLPGDIESAVQARLCRAGADLRANVLVMPHHGSWKDALPEFVATAAPSVILVSNSREQPLPADASPQRVEFLRSLRSGYRYYSTARNGWIRVRFGEGGVDVDTMR